MRPYSTIKVDAVAVGAGCDKSLSILAVKDHRIVLGSSIRQDGLRRRGCQAI